MLNFIVLGGPVLWVLIGLSMVACFIVIERLIYLRQITAEETKLFQKTKVSLLKGRYNETLAICNQNISPFSTLLKVGIKNRHQPQQIQREILKDAVSLEAPKLERGVWWLGTISNIAPLLGLLGTVTGTMRAFGVLAKFGSGNDPSQLAGGVAEALITTVGGIIVAVPAVIFYNYFVSRIGNIFTRLENQVSSLVSFINAPATVNIGKDLRSGKPARVVKEVRVMEEDDQMEDDVDAEDEDDSEIDDEDMVEPEPVKRKKPVKGTKVVLEEE
jgi:biopolymer transport protein ExbB